MGLKGEAIQVFRKLLSENRGLYNYHGACYNISVDGELMRYSGCTEENLAHAQCEAMIADTAIRSTNSVIDRVKRFMGPREPKHIYIYMDGLRVENKVTRPSNSVYSNSVVRTLYCHGINLDSRYILKMLNSGESELKMYLERDTDVDLNIFITRDSDMIPILYGHMPHIISLARGGHTRRLNQEPYFEDYNLQYAEGSIVKDSCVWLNNNSSAPILFGMDNIQEMIGYSTFAFRTLCALSGTDFTKHGLTKSAVDIMLRLPQSDKEIINRLHTPFEMYLAFISFAIKCRAQMVRLKRSDLKMCSLNGLDLQNRLNEILYTYNKYIATGIMPVDKMPAVLMGPCVAKILYCMVGRQAKPKDQRKSIECVSIPELIKITMGRIPTFSNYILQHDFDVFDCDNYNVVGGGGLSLSPWLSSLPPPSSSSSSLQPSQQTSSLLIKTNEKETKKKKKKKKKPSNKKNDKNKRKKPSSSSSPPLPPTPIIIDSCMDVYDENLFAATNDVAETLSFSITINRNSNV